jgi:VanZ family protein
VTATPGGRAAPDGATDPLLYGLLVGLSLAVIGYFTLFPFDFHIPEDQTLLDVVSALDLEFARSYVYADIPLNVVLFIPLGFSLAGWMSTSRVERKLAFAGAVAVGTLVSSLVELVQGVALTRFPSASDVVANGFGAALGMVVFAHVGERVTSTAASLGRRAARIGTVWQRGAIYLLYFVAVVATSAWLQTTSRLSDWDQEHPLIVGNEVTADRPWSGTMRSFYIIDRSISNDEVQHMIDLGVGGDRVDGVVALHDFTVGEGGHPRLTWNGGEPVLPDPEGIQLGGPDWLRSDGPATDITRALMRSSEFTLGVEIAANNTYQDGPARIVSISDGLTSRNLTLAQEGRDLVVRIRTPLTGTDGTDPEWIVPDVFVDTSMRRLVLRYDGSSARVTVNETTTQAIDLVPETAALLSSFPNDLEQVRLGTAASWALPSIYRLVLFVPLSAVLAGARVRSSTHTTQVVAVACALLIPAAALEVALSSSIGRYDLHGGRVFANAALIGGTWLAHLAFQHQWRKRAARFGGMAEC